MTSFNLNYLLKAHRQVRSQWDWRFSTWISGGTQSGAEGNGPKAGHLLQGSADSRGWGSVQPILTTGMAAR